MADISLMHGLDTDKGQGLCGWLKGRESSFSYGRTNASRRVTYTRRRFF